MKSNKKSKSVMESANYSKNGTSLKSACRRHKNRHRFILLQLLLLLFFGSVTAVYAQSDRKFNKEMEKVYKKKHSELKQQGWVVSGTSLTLEVALMKHLRAINSDDANKELVAEVSMCKSANVCKANAQNNAMVEYANSAGSYIRGRVYSLPCLC